MNRTSETSTLHYNGTESLTINDTLLRSLLERHILGPAQGSDIFTVGLIVLYVPTFMSGLIGNGLLCLIILTRRRFRNITNLLLCNLTIADISGRSNNCFLSRCKIDII